ncbi:hypothetical protein FRB94_008914 [Tulasnella sp. JGI-2019a]|nr:hypothetical protein FRB93_008552 [Tulasnella sp. JGI-2019a]KAG8995632.1 hypothetical protein FRB94_008914 [Tulasnella sp. JGI-2019a]KAG9027263.1 hypothetical protein FRB95_007946 [Tulasnella sp. JGI-2019a]
MEAYCDSCQLDQRKFYCKDCLRAHLRDFRTSTQRAATERDNEVARAKVSLESITSGRLLRADRARLEDSISEITQETSSLYQRIAQARDKISMKRTALSKRRASLHEARSILSAQVSLSSPTNINAQIQSQLRTINTRALSTESALTSTRKVLIKSLVEAFDLREAAPLEPPPRSAQRMSASSASLIAGAGKALFGKGSVLLVNSAADLSGRLGAVVTKSEWSISGLILPVPGDLRRYSQEHVTAAVGHTLHFLCLLTCYLGVKLPFEIIWSGGAPSMGLPSIVAGRGPERGGWANSTEPYPLWLADSESVPSTSSDGAATSSPSPSLLLKKPTVDNFTTGLCMLNYNIAYLAHTQGLEIPLSLTSETLRNLWAVCHISTDAYARASHSTPSRAHTLPPPTTSPNFTLEFGQLLQISSPRSSSSAAGSRSSRYRKSSKTDRNGAQGVEDEWNLVEIDEVDEGIG